MTLELNFNNHVVTVDVLYRKGQHRLIIRPLAINHYRVSAPKGMPKYQIKAHLESDPSWLENLPNVISYDEYLAQASTLKLFNEDVKVEIIESPFNEVRFRAQGLTVMMREPNEAMKVKLLKDYFKLLLMKEVEWLETMYRRTQSVINLDAVQYRFKFYRSKFGSCHIKNRHLHFNITLVHYPKEYLDYVYAHEIAHLKVPNHGASFYSLLETLLPRHAALKEALNDHHKTFFIRNEAPL